MAILDSLFVKLGYDYDESSLEEFNDFVDTSARLVKGLSIAVIGLATSFAILFLNVSKNALAQYRFGKAMGLSRNTISAFERASDKLTGSKGTATSMLETFNGINNAMKAGQKPSDEFIRGIAELGLDFGKFISLDPAEQLLQVSEAFQRSGDNTQDMVTHLLGMDTAARNLVSTLTRQSISDNMPTDADIARAEKFDNLIKSMSNTFRDAALVAGNELFPQLDAVFKRMEESLPTILNFTKELISGFLEFADFLGNTVGFLTVEFDRLIKTIEKLLGFELFSLKDIGNSLGSGLFNIFGGNNEPSTVPQVPGNTTGGFNQENKIEINVTATDASAAGVAVKNGVEQALQTAARNAEGQEVI